MPIEFCAYITRQQVRATAASHTYLFGDNERRTGLGGQAREMRGEPNAIGIRTKAAPHNGASAFWHDHGGASTPYYARMVDIDFARVYCAIERGRIIVIPRDGLGTGRARLSDNAQQVLIHISRCLAYCHKLDEWCEAHRAGLVWGEPPWPPYAADDMAERIARNLAAKAPNYDQQGWRPV